MTSRVGSACGRGRAGRRDHRGEREGQLAQALLGRRGYRAGGHAAGGEHRGHLVRALAGGRNVDLVERDDSRPVAEVSAGGGLIGGQFPLDHVQVGERVAAWFLDGAVEHVHQDRAAFHVPEEVESETLAVARPGDKAGHVGDDELGLPRLGHAQVRDQGGERIVCDLRPGRREHGNERGLARVREADQAGIRHGLELQDQRPRGPWLAAEREAGSLAAGGGEGRVSQPAAAALGRDEHGSGADQIGQHGTGLGFDHRAVRDPEDKVIALGPAPVGAGPRLAVARPPERPAVEVQQRRGAGIDFDDHIAAAASVTPVRAAERLELLPVDRGTAMAAVTRLHSHLSLISELSHCRTSCLSSCAAPSCAAPSCAAPSCAAVSCAVAAAPWLWTRVRRHGPDKPPAPDTPRAGRLPGPPSRQRLVNCCGGPIPPASRQHRHTGTTLMARRPRRVPNSTVPVIRANRVSSPPRPTPGPGWKWVPCWRTMISPAPTSWPPNRFTPSR